MLALQDSESGCWDFGTCSVEVWSGGGGGGGGGGGEGKKKEEKQRVEVVVHCSVQEYIQQYSYLAKSGFVV